MFHIDELHDLTADELYKALFEFSQGLVAGERNMIANLANISSLLFHTLTQVNWVGFYLLHHDELILGPFQGKPACIRIPIGKGVCGTAVAQKTAQLVKNVHMFPGHIACDGDTNSELVIPLIRDGKIYGVLDLDSPVLERFSEEDQQGLEKIVELLIQHCDWEV